MQPREKLTEATEAYERHLERAIAAFQPFVAQAIMLGLDKETIVEAVETCYDYLIRIKEWADRPEETHNA